MHRIDHPTAAEALPTPASPGDPGYFDEGDPVGGTPATVVTADWANAVQEELVAVVVAGGGSPSKSVRTQVRDAIQVLINGVQQRSLQGAFRNLKGSAPGNSSIVTYTIDELITGNGAGEYQTTRTWNKTINMSASGAGDLDTGTVDGSTWYYAYGITKPDGTKDCIASLSSSSPALPSGYTNWARIGSFRTDASGNKYPFSFIQYGRVFRYKIASATNTTAFPVVASGALGSWPSSMASVSLSSAVPPTACIANISMSPALNAAVAPSSNYVVGSISTYANPLAFSNANFDGNTAVTQTDVDVVLETAQTIYGSIQTPGTDCYLAVRGWEENL